MEMTCFSSPDAVGHAYILSSPSREDALRKAREIASAVVCLNGHDVPCGVKIIGLSTVFKFDAYYFGHVVSPIS